MTGLISKPRPQDAGEIGSAATEAEANRLATFQHLNDICREHGIGARWASVRQPRRLGIMRISRPLTGDRSLTGGWRI